MQGFFDPKDGNPKILLEIQGTNKDLKKKIVALFDTGHSGSLSLPVLNLVEVGAKLSSVGEVELADGYKKATLFFSVTVSIDGYEKEVEASLIENPETSEAIAGLELFSPYTALVDFKNKKLVFSKAEDLEGI